MPPFDTLTSPAEDRLIDALLVPHPDGPLAPCTVAQADVRAVLSTLRALRNAHAERGTVITTLAQGHAPESCSDCGIVDAFRRQGEMMRGLWRVIDELLDVQPTPPVTSRGADQKAPGVPVPQLPSPAVVHARICTADGCVRAGDEWAG